MASVDLNEDELVLLIQLLTTEQLSKWEKEKDSIPLATSLKNKLLEARTK